MVFGMFMAILDIQIVSASLAEIQAGLSASSDEISWVQTAYLIAEVVMIPLSGFLARMLSTRVLFTVSAAGFTAASALCAHGDHHRPDDRLPGDPGFHRRRHDPQRLRRRLHDLPAVAARHRLADDRPRRHARADHRPDGRRLYQPCLLLALAVPDQRRARHAGRQRRLVADRLRQAQPGADEEVRLVGPCRHGGLPRLARIRARGRPDQRLAAGRQRVRCSRSCSSSARSLFFWRVVHAEEPIVDLRAFGNRQFRLRLACSPS